MSHWNVFTAGNLCMVWHH